MSDKLDFPGYEEIFGKDDTEDDEGEDDE